MFDGAVLTTPPAKVAERNHVVPSPVSILPRFISPAKTTVKEFELHASITPTASALADESAIAFT